MKDITAKEGSFKVRANSASIVVADSQAWHRVWWSCRSLAHACSKEWRDISLNPWHSSILTIDRDASIERALRHRVRPPGIDHFLWRYPGSLGIYFRMPWSFVEPVSRTFEARLETKSNILPESPSLWRKARMWRSSKASILSCDWEFWRYSAEISNVA